jgi:PTS system fructose-specific IIA component
MSEVFKREHISINADFKCKDDYLKYIAGFSTLLGISEDKQGVYEGLLHREKEFETNLGSGIAIPHTKSRCINRPAILIVKPKNEVHWGGDYEEAVKIIICILSPDNQKDNVHLKLLASLSRKLIYDDFKSNLITASIEEEVYKLIDEALKAEL